MGQHVDPWQTDQEVYKFQQDFTGSKDAAYQVNAHDTEQCPVNGTDYDQYEGDKIKGFHDKSPSTVSFH